MMDDFAGLLHRYRTRDGRSCNDLAHAIQVDPSYISRLERGEREPPRRPVVQRLADAMALRPQDEDQLMVSAGYAPNSLIRLGGWNPTLQQVAAVLGDAQIPADRVLAFSAVVQQIAKQWRMQPSAPTLAVAAEEEQAG